MFCLTNSGFVQCYSLGSHKVCCTLLFNFALFSNFCFACFASQTSGLCSTIPSALVKFVARLCLILLYSVIFVLRALPHKHRVLQCYTLGSRKFCCMVVFILLYSVIFALRVCAVLFPSAPLKFAPFCS